MQFDFTADEHETFVNWDYATGMVHFYTTKRHVWEHVLKRLRDIPGAQIKAKELTVSVPIKWVRDPWRFIKTTRKAKT